MKKFLALIFTLLSLTLLSGCATYKFHHGQAPYDKGYVVSRDDYDMLEYTLGPNNTVPDRKLAKTRFLRRRDIVEDYYKKMGLIENHFKMAVWDPASMFLKLIGGIFRLPFIALADYRYEHDFVYREKVNKMDKLKDEQEDARVKALKDKLNNYVQKDLEKETAVKALSADTPVGQQEAIKIEVVPIEQTAPAVAQKTEIPAGLVIPEKQEPAAVKKELPVMAQVLPEAAIQPKETPKVEEPKVKEVLVPEAKEPIKQEIIQEPQIAEKKAENTEVIKEKALQQAQQKEAGISAVIIARPQKGYSPLKVNFSGTNSRALRGRIVAYAWDFGDGDISTKPNCVNTYYSNTSEPKYFNVTLTVKDNRGNTAQASTVIEVLNK
ncbi:MAG: PKD domain-containing protein [Candidatus Omnitrophica bacterium]|nr:PKD domain-containing protein [Candidatus Omnitrophota bacterium]